MKGRWGAQWREVAIASAFVAEIDELIEEHERRRLHYEARCEVRPCATNYYQLGQQVAKLDLLKCVRAIGIKRAGEVLLGGAS